MGVLPAKVLSDFARAAHDLRTGDGRMWFRNVYKGEQPKVQTASLCAAREKATLCPPPTEHGRGARAVLPCSGRIFPRAPPPYKNNRSTRPRRPTIDRFAHTCVRPVKK